MIKPPTKCEPCKGTGIAKQSVVLGWGIVTPPFICRHCLGKGKVPHKDNS